MSTLMDEFEVFEKPPQKCKVCDWRSGLSEEHRAFFDGLVGENMAKMTRFCADKLGLDAEESTVRKHVHKCL